MIRSDEYCVKNAVKFQSVNQPDIHMNSLCELLMLIAALLLARNVMRRVTKNTLVVYECACVVDIPRSIFTHMVLLLYLLQQSVCPFVCHQPEFCHQTNNAAW